MILANIDGTRITTNVEKQGRSYGVIVIIDRRHVAHLRKRHKVFWTSHVYPNCPEWAAPFLDRVQWGTHASIDNLRCTVATILQRAFMVAHQVRCECGKRPATGFKQDRDGTKAIPDRPDNGFVDAGEPVPQCMECRR
ncbi:MAG: hypothetical protein OXE96_16210 [Gemmatimonadetes bacterium]|nr:hypothetical protein [Gemmatimonadota bacterium]